MIVDAMRRSNGSARWCMDHMVDVIHNMIRGMCSGSSIDFNEIKSRLTTMKGSVVKHN